MEWKLEAMHLEEFRVYGFPSTSSTIAG